MDVRIARTSGTPPIFNRTRRCKYVFVCLRAQSASSKIANLKETHIYEDNAPEKAIPRVFRVVVVPFIEEDGEFIPGHHELPTAQLLPRPEYH
jgi:hypothetical protein